MFPPGAYSEAKTILEGYGDVELVERPRPGELVVRLFDSRDASALHSDAASAQLIAGGEAVRAEFVSEESARDEDAVMLSAVSGKLVSAIRKVMERLGEVAEVSHLDSFTLLVRYYDLRCAWKARLLLSMYCAKTCTVSEPNTEAMAQQSESTLVLPNMSASSIALDNLVWRGKKENLSPNLAPRIKEELRIKDLERYEGIRKRGTSDQEKTRFRIDLAAVRIGKDTRTTVMVRNIPNKYSQKMLLETIDQHHAGQYNFVYLPIDFKNRCNVGYAFVNFRHWRNVGEFCEEFEGKKWPRFNSEKICTIAYARLQGLEALVGHFRNSSVMTQLDSRIKPVIILN